MHQGPEGTLIGTTLSHYRILERLGEGATSVVYKAEDLSLGRVVALKLLPSPSAPDLGKIARFQHEARTASTLSHPNICTIFEIGDHDGRHFISMEFLEGQPLSTLIGGRPLDAYRLIELAIQIADGLEAAHAERIIHRDLKPANIYVTWRDHVKLLDFGLSVLMPFGTGTRTPPSATWLAEPGGTAPYMSPEQTLGEQLDTRSDLFSFGVVLYEMSTGSRPFTGATNAALLDAIRQESPFPARDLNTSVPDELNRIIEKALEKNRKLRYQTASDISADLRRLKRDLDAPPRVAAATPAAAVVAASPPAPSEPGGSRWRTAQIVAAAALAGALAASGIPWHRAVPPAASAAAEATPEVHVSVAPTVVPAPDVSTAGLSRPSGPPERPPAASPPAPAPLPVVDSPPVLVDDFDAIDRRRAPVWADEQYDIAQAKADLRLYDQAIATLDDLIRNHGSTAAAPRAYLLKAEVLDRQGRRDDAMATYLEMAGRYPEHPRAAEALVAIADGVRDSRGRDGHAEARRLYTDVVVRFPTSPWAARALLSRAELEQRLRLFRGDEVLGTSVPLALVTYRELAIRYPGSPEREHALWRLAQMYEDMGRIDLAVQALADLARHYPSTRYEAWFTAGELYDKRLKEPDQARTAYAQVPPTSSRYADAQKRLHRR